MTPARAPRIVVVDGFTANPGDLDWAPLGALGALDVYERSGPALFERCRGADIVLTNKERFDASLLDRLPNLRCVSVTATGTNVVDLAAAKERGVVVCNVPGYSTASVAQHTFALLLELTNRVFQHAEAARDGRWTRSLDFSYSLSPWHELADKRLGVIGLGAIGRHVAGIGQALGMEVVTVQRGEPRVVAGVPLPGLPLAELFATSDVISLHCPLTPETERMVNATRLGSMKPSALLVNTGRGALIDEDALGEALRAGHIAGAALDVLCQEPPPLDHPLLALPNCLVTPHLAWASVEARQRLLDVSIENVAAFLRGTPVNVVA